jgi:hypothetical protein
MKFTIFYGVTPYNHLLDHQSFGAKHLPLPQAEEGNKEETARSRHPLMHAL